MTFSASCRGWSGWTFAYAISRRSCTCTLHAPQRLKHVPPTSCCNRFKLFSKPFLACRASRACRQRRWTSWCGAASGCWWTCELQGGCWRRTRPAPSTSSCVLEVCSVLVGTNKNQHIGISLRQTLRHAWPAPSKWNVRISVPAKAYLEGYQSSRLSCI